MKLLLTSAGIKNPTLNDAMVELLGKPIAECDALCIPTASYGHAPCAGCHGAYRFITGRATTPMIELGWKSLGVLELAALPSIDRDAWVPVVEEADVLLVGGGDALYLAPLDAAVRAGRPLAVADETVWVGLSAGSMVMTPRSARTSRSGTRPAAATERWESSTSRSSRTWITRTAENTMAAAEQWAAGCGPAYAIDDQTAISVVDGTVDVISEGTGSFSRRGRCGAMKMALV